MFKKFLKKFNLNINEFFDLLIEYAGDELEEFITKKINQKNKDSENAKNAKNAKGPNGPGKQKGTEGKSEEKD